MMTDEHFQECLSVSYLRAIAAAAGVNFKADTFDHDYGVDGTFAKIRAALPAAGGRRMIYQNGARLDFQLKATTQWRPSKQCDGKISYSLAAGAYNRLAATNSGIEKNSCAGMVPVVLMVLCLPQSSKREDWFRQESSSLVLMHQIYWKYISGGPTSNKSSVTVSFSSDDVVTPELISDLLDRIEAGSLPE